VRSKKRPTKSSAIGGKKRLVANIVKFFDVIFDNYYESTTIYWSIVNKFFIEF